jgi:hypothetical protein
VTLRVLISNPLDASPHPHLMDNLHDDTPQSDSEEEEFDWEEVYIPSQPQIGPSATTTSDVSIAITPTDPTIEITLESRKGKKEKADAL